MRDWVDEVLKQVAPQAETATRNSAAKVQGVVGYMYTTWANNYGDLEQFARQCR